VILEPLPSMISQPTLLKQYFLRTLIRLRRNER
jgi:hypothetical protein